tara:strand:- start:3 stop:1343 length:1341 start_codon:yes stop_codon:yes gene_type:complete
MRINLPNSKTFSKIFNESTGIKISESIKGIATDSREIQSGDLYIAIKGEKVDGHSFLNQVFENGALAALVSDINDQVHGNQIQVRDTIESIGKIATEWRRQFNIPIIGITGSNGKTSTKELLRHILSSKFDIHATEGNYNTSIGLPLTLLQLNAFHGASILEMGANRAGDIEILAKIANPNFGLITNIAPAHLEGFGSIEAVAKTKAAIFENLGNGIAFVNAADRRVKEIALKVDSISFGLNPDCDYPADLHYEEDGTITLTINTEEIPTLSSNLSFAKNIIACCAIARELDVEWEAIKDRVSTFSPPKGRCEVKNNGSYIIIDDTYNANLESTLAAIDYLSAFSGQGKKVFIFGDMLELGDVSREQHIAIGKKCDEMELSAVLTYGKETIATSESIKKVKINQHFDSKEELIDFLQKIIKSNDKILIKGSRGMRMETIIQGIMEN